MSRALLQEGWKFLWPTRILVIAGVEFLQELGAPLVLFQVLHQPLVAHHILPNDVVALLCVLGNVVQLLHPVEEKHINDLGVGDALVLPDLLGDAGAELGGGHDVVEVVDLHDGGDGAAGLPEEVEHAVPRLPHRRRVRRNLHRAHRERHLFALAPLRRLSPAAALSLAARPQVVVVVVVVR